MKAKELRNKSTKELTKNLADTQKDLASSIVDHRTKEVKNIKQIAQYKKDIARIKTILREQELAGEAK